MNCGANAPHETHSRPTHAHVHYARPSRPGPPWVRSAPSAPSGGGTPGPGRCPRRLMDFRFPRAPVPWASRAYYGRPTEIRPISTTTRVPELVQVATIHPPLRGFPRSGGARWMPTYTCYLSIGRDTHTPDPVRVAFLPTLRPLASLLSDARRSSPLLYEDRTFGSAATCQSNPRRHE